MSETTMPEFWVAQGDDRLGEHLASSVADFSFKVSTEDSQGSLLVVEVSFHAKGGPARHIQFNQEEWFYVLEGEYLFEIGQERFRLKPGDSALAPRKVPHVFAFVGDGAGRILSVLTPAGQAEAFFRAISKAPAGALDPDFYRTYGLELVGPPLAIE